MIIMRYGPLSVAEEFFAIPDLETRVDMLRCHQISAPVGLDCVVAQATLVIDLAESEDLLLNRVDKATRYEIRRAETRDGVLCRLLDHCQIDAECLRQLVKTYDAFALTKHVSPINRQRLNRLQAQGNLYISRAESVDGTALVWHVYLSSQGRVRLLYSVSLFRNAQDAAYRSLVGRANRMLHWKDIATFRKRGMKFYDFGGYYLGQTDADKLRINKFKESFGGMQRTEYNGFRFVSFAGCCVGRILQLWMRLTAGRKSVGGAAA